MITRSDFSPSKSRRLVNLEASWNVALQNPHQPRRHLQMTKDIKKFILQSIDGDVHQAERKAAAKSKKTDDLDIFGKISSTFNFTHHEGTDAKTELKVVKIILIREGQIMTLAHLSNKVKSSDNVTGSCTGILEVLAEIRESTLNYLEALCLWRQTIPNGNNMSPRIFFWEGKNYTLKIVNDLDFLADNALIIQSLNITPEQFRNNPLMLTNNLDDPNTWMDPVERAGQDAGGVTQGTVFESRLRLRFAERILLQEIELATNPSVEDSGFFLTEPQSQHPQGYGQYSSKYQPHYQQQQQSGMSSQFGPSSNVAAKHPAKQLVKGSSALEADFDDDSYTREDDSGGLQGGLMDKSTWGLPVSFEDKVGRVPSGDSDSAVRPSLPHSRSSSINNSAPNSSQSQRNGGQINSLRAGHTGPATVNGTGTNTGNNTASSTSSGRGGGFEYGHDFFSGHWAESRPFLASYENSNSVEEGGSYPIADNYGGNAIFFVDEGRDMSPLGNLQNKRKGKMEAIDDASVGSQQSNGAVSIKSIDSVASVEVHVISNIRHPPKNLVLAATACVILLTPGPEIPKDVSWAAFIKMCNTIDVSGLLRTLDPVKIHKFKVLAIQPMLEQMMDEMTYDGLVNNSTPYHEYSAVNKLVSWVQQFTTLSINKQACRRPHPILAPSPATTARKTREQQQQLGGTSTKTAMTTTTTGTANAINESTKSLVINGPEVGNLPVKKRVIPSASLQLVPFYSEVDSTLYKTPLLIALLGSFDKKSSFLSQRKPRPPRSGKFELEEVDDLDRLVVKVYDVLGTAEYHHTVIIREYVIFLAELQEDYHNLAHKYFQPEDRAWWAAHIKEVLVVQPKPQNKLKLWVSRKAIEQIVADGVASGAEPKPLVKITTVPSPKETLTAGPNTSTATPSDFIISEKKNTILGSKSGTPGVTEKTLSTKGNASAPLGSVKVPPNVSAKAGQMSSNGSTSVKSSKTKQQAESFPATTEATRGASLAPVVTDKKPREGSAPSKKVTLATSVKIISPKSNAGSGGASSKDNASKKGSSKAISKPTVAVAAAKASIVTAPAAASVAKATKADVPSSPIATPAEPVVPAAIAQTYVQADVADDSPQDVAVASDVAKSENASADVDYNEDFEADSVVVGKGKDIVDTTVTVEMETAVEGKVPVAVADYDEDFEEENSLENENENGTTADDANTTDAVHSASAADADACSHQDQDQDHDTVQDTVQDHDQENDQDQDATSKSAVTAMAVGGASDGKGDADSRYFSDFEENSLGVNSGIILDDQSSVNIIEECYENNGDDKNNSNRPLSMIEAAQREFDEIGEDDGVFFNSVDDEDF